jgi:hypothetical protein
VGDNASVAVLIEVGATFVWLGMVSAISLLEAPLKFRAPGITLELGLGIGRLVFRALNRAEVTLAALATAGVLAEPRGMTAGVLLAALWVVLLVQLLALRPPLDRRAALIIEGATPPRSRLHLAYVALEAVKVVGLVALGTVLVLG